MTFEAGKTRLRRADVGRAGGDRPRGGEEAAAGHVGLGRLRPDRRDAPDRRRVAVRGRRPPRDRDACSTSRPATATPRSRRRAASPTSRRPTTCRELLEQGRRRAEAERLAMRFQVADAEQLPFPDESFDVVLSTFGVMFAPNQERAASELMRVAKPGGRIGLASWTPEGFIGRLFERGERVRAAAAGAALAHGLGHGAAARRAVRPAGLGHPDASGKTYVFRYRSPRSTGSSTSARTTGRRTRRSPRSTRRASRRSRRALLDLLREWDRGPRARRSSFPASTSRR